ncbi:MAG TPA: phosphotransferase [Ktedonobacterales bacterium]|jgi:hypothetical protein
MDFSEYQPKKLVWQRPEHLLQPEHLAVVLSAARRSENRFFSQAFAHLDPSSDLRVTQVQHEPLQGGVSGAHLEQVRVQYEASSARHPPAVMAFSLILKRVPPRASWLMRASGDTLCREVQLWCSDVLDDLPPALLTPALAASYDVQTGEGALLMADIGRWLGRFEDCFLPVSPGQQMLTLDHLARLHAHYWNDVRLSNMFLGLASPHRALLLLSPESIAVQRATGDTHPYLAAAQSGWEAFFKHALPEPARRIQRVLNAPDRFLASAAAMPATLVHGDVWPPNMGLWPGERGTRGQREGNKTLLIDWALAAAGPASYDLFWLLFYWRKVDTRRALLTYRQRLTKHLARRGIRLSAAEWSMLVDLGVVRTVLTCGETMGQAIILATNDASRARAIALLHQWTSWADRVIARRGWDQ